MAKAYANSFIMKIQGHNMTLMDKKPLKKMHHLGHKDWDFSSTKGFGGQKTIEENASTRAQRLGFCKYKGIWGFVMLGNLGIGFKQIVSLQSRRDFFFFPFYFADVDNSFGPKKMPGMHSQTQMKATPTFSVEPIGVSQTDQHGAL